MSQGRHVSAETIERIRQMWLTGEHLITGIAAECAVHPNTVHGLAQRNEWIREPEAEARYRRNLSVWRGGHNRDQQRKDKPPRAPRLSPFKTDHWGWGRGAQTGGVDADFDS